MGDPGPGTADDPATALATARDLLARHEWQAAYDVLVAAAVADERPADGLADAERLEARAEAAWWLGRLDECIEGRQAAYAIFDAGDAGRPAAHCAVRLYEHYCFKAQPNVGGAWLRRARRHVEADVDCAEYGNLVLRELEVVHGRGDLDEAAATARSVIDLGRRLRLPDIEAEALQALGRVLIDQGRPRAGLEHLDEAMLLGLEGRLSPYSTGKVFCSLISACEELGDYRRAAEWTDATSRWSARHPLAVFPGLCRVHRAWALECRGELARAEEEVLRACRELEEVSPVHAAVGFAELAEVRRRRGDLAGAEAASGEAEARLGRAPAGLARLRLAQGRVDEAAAIIAGALEEETWNRLARARLLPVRVEIALAADDRDAAAVARDAGVELDEIAEEYDTPALQATAAATRGRIALASGDLTAASDALRDALARWQDLDVPFEVATVRVLLGRTCRAAGDEDAARGSFAAAAAIYEHLGAELDLRAVQELADRPEPLTPAGLTHREVEVLRLVASGRSNRAVADELFLSERTVARHLSNIFAKTGVSSRAGATAFAFEHGLARR